MDIELFVSRLKQVVFRTSALLQGYDYHGSNHGAVFRQMNPLLPDGMPLYAIDNGYTTWNADVYSVENFHYALDTVLQQREQHETLVGSEFFESGRILCFSTLLTTHDGIAIAASNCFVDESDVPPIDTWFYIEEDFLDNYRPTLFCWIPKEFEAIMQGTMRSDMMKSYEWLDEATPVFYHRLSKRLKEISSK
jgi:hypothetical protein